MGIRDSLERSGINGIIIIILLNEICERYTYYSLKSLLVFYLTDAHGYDKNDAQFWYHIWIVFCYFTPIFGATVADSYLGKYKTILYVSCIYSIGVLFTVLGAIPGFGVTLSHAFMVAGLVVVAIGTGGIKPCISSFGGDQFQNDPDKETKQRGFFTWFYIVINMGSVTASFFGPVLRTQSICQNYDFLKIQSGGDQSCYSLAFFFPFIMFIISIIIFVSAHTKYIKNPAVGENILIKAIGAVYFAARNSLTSSQKQEITDASFTSIKIEQGTCLDRAIPKYGEKFIRELQCCLKVVLFCLPLCLFWAIFDQQGSRWTLQSRQMDGYLKVPGGFIWHVLPDQAHTLNPFFIVTLSPLIRLVFLSGIEKCINRKVSEIHLMILGMVFSAFAAFLAGTCQTFINSDLPHHYPESNTYFVRNITGNPIFSDSESDFVYTSDCDMMSGADSDFCAMVVNKPERENAMSDGLLKKSMIRTFVNGKSHFFDYELTKSSSGGPIIHFLNAGGKDVKLQAPSIYHETKMDDLDLNQVIKSFGTNEDGIQKWSYTLSTNTAPNDLKVKYNFTIGGSLIDFKFKPGGIYTVVYDESSVKKYTVFGDVADNKFGLAWQVFQYLIITCAEILISITGLEFAYKQAPIRMKSLLQACWLLTTAMGNVINTFMSKFSTNGNARDKEFFFLSVALLVAAVGMTYLGMLYKYTTPEELEEINNCPDKHGESEASEEKQQLKMKRLR